ncbi:UbiX family flavin prenyltransferase [Ensifer sp. ENS11]|uniref:UbiX family flavin prenyltransferase n=1 Tax=Ensifer sp. ENS11 TaxID=2769291 RepID=UPI00177C6015|nr:UbiX family flavin prenyltransferase [Ensifer sp. ENS11]MBD9488064.1 UbiX family flavin prenyltransferase [Ensifer sp. ENS11]
MTTENLVPDATSASRKFIVPQPRKRFVVAITGASGHIYGIRLLEVLRELNCETHLVMSKSAMVALAYETDIKVKDIRDRADHVYSNDDVAAAISSGSFRTQGMFIAPCSAKTLGEIASGACGTLVSRAADVMLKERRRLVLMFRETPLHLGHCRNMVSVTEMGAIVMPPVPAFYSRPETVDDIIDHTVGRALDLFDLDVGVVKRWKE